MINISKVQQLAEEHLANTDLFLVDITVSASNKISVYIDRDEHIVIKDCLALSRHIEGNLDREIEDYELEVSSPGLNKPFKVFRQYQKNIGKLVQVVLKDGRKIEGILAEASNDNIVLEQTTSKRIEGRKAKEKITERIPLTSDAIKETKIVIVF